MNDQHATRIEYTSELRTLQDDVLRLGSMVDRQIVRAVDALGKQDVSGARQVIELDQNVNNRRWKIENDTMTIIARQGPMAGDLRRIMASVHIATNLERMGDHAEGIARLTLRTADQPHLHELDSISEMADTGRAMLTDALQSYVDIDPNKAREIAKRDDEVDQLYERVYRELLTIMIADPDTVSRATHLLWVAHNLERIADRVTNICERIIFSVTGEFEEVNRKDFGERFSDTN
ncbi:MAG: phosphate signaling complex protein PhoU [Thermomicrobiales bacterium]